MSDEFHARRSPDLSDMDFIGALMCFGGWPQVGWGEAEARLYAEVLTKTPFEEVSAASIWCLGAANEAELRREGLTRRQFEAGKVWPYEVADILKVRRKAEKERGERGKNGENGERGESGKMPPYEWVSRPWEVTRDAEEAQEMLERRIRTIRAFRGILPEMSLVGWIKEEIRRQKEMIAKWK